MTVQAGPAARIVVIGGGAGGLELAIRLAQKLRLRRRADVVLIDRRASHVWKPRLHEIAAGLLNLGQEEADYNVLGAQHGFRFVMGEVCELNLGEREVHVAGTRYPAGDDRAGSGSELMLPAQNLTFDIAVLAIGSTVNDFHILGVNEHCHTLDTPESSDKLSRALFDGALRVKAGVQNRLHVAVVGAGTTGVEFAAELRNASGRLARFKSMIEPGQLDISLLETADRPMFSSSEELSSYARKMLEQQKIDLRLSTKVSRIDPGCIGVDGGTSIAADLVIWTSGVKPRQLAVPVQGVARGKDGRIAVDQTLHAVGDDGRSYEQLYGIGDCASGKDDAKAPATAQAAQQQAQHLSRLIARRLRGRKELPFRYRDKGTLVSLGGERAVGDVKTPLKRSGVRITGVAAKTVYDGLYAAHFRELFGLRRTIALRLSQLFRRSAKQSAKLYW